MKRGKMAARTPPGDATGTDVSPIAIDCDDEQVVQREARQEDEAEEDTSAGEERHVASGSGAGGAMNCSICLEVMLPPQPDRRVAAMRACGHILHAEWCAVGRRTVEGKTCSKRENKRKQDR